MNCHLPSASLRSLLFLLLIIAVLAVESAQSSQHFATSQYRNTVNKDKQKLEQIVVNIKEECKNIGGADPCGPCLIDILKAIEQGEASSIASDDNTSSQQAIESEENTQNSEGTTSTQSKCRLIISKVKHLIQKNAGLKTQLSTANTKIGQQDQTISQKDQQILSKENSLRICSDFLKECQAKQCDPSSPCPPPVSCEDCEDKLRAANNLLILSQNENAVLRKQIEDFEESLSAWSKLLLSSLPQAGSEVLSLQEFSSHSKINVTALAASLGNLLNLANTPSDNFLQSSQNYQNEVSILSGSFVKLIQSTFAFAASSSHTKKQCQNLFKDYKSAVSSLSQCNDILTGKKLTKQDK